MRDKKNLDLAKLKADDEFYTSFADIVAELSHWTSKLKDKKIICPCDFVPTKKISSVTIDFSQGRYFINSVKKKASDTPYFSLFDDFVISDPAAEISESQLREILSNQEVVNFVNYLWAVGKEAGIKSITASGYNIKSGLGVSFDEVDYNQYDLVITNPPFSLYSSFMECIGDIDKIIIAPFMNRVAPCVAIPLMERKTYLGYGRHLAMNFNNPTGGKGKKVAVDWIVSWSDAQDEIDKLSCKTGIRWDVLSYKDMPYMTMKDGTKPIKINSVQQIPDDYDGYMFTSVAVLDKLSYADYDWICTGCKRYFNKEHPELNPFAHNVSNEMIGYGTENSCFHGVLFKRKHII